MTSPTPDDLRDPRLDAAWRDFSHEEAPAALSEAVRAAARREVGAGPLRTGSATRSPRVLDATRPQRWWWPLAAAATIGVIAFGLLQLEPAVNGGPSVVSDMPATPAQPAPAAPQALPSEPAAPRATAPASPARRDAVPADIAAGATAEMRSVEMRPREGARLPVADWIALIRRLRDEGSIDEAAKELAAFRVAYPDHEQRLPADLRDWRVPGK